MTIYQDHELESALAAEAAAWALVRAQLPHVDLDRVDLTSLGPVQLAAAEALLAARRHRQRHLRHPVPPQH